MDKVKNFLAGAGFKTLVFLLVIAVSIPVTIFLIKQQQILKSKATSELIQFTGNNIKTINDATGNIRQIATLEDIEVEVTIPTNASPIPSSSTSPAARPSSSPSPSPSLSPTPNPSASATPRPSSTPTTTSTPTARCPSTHTLYSCSDVTCPNGSTAPGSGCYSPSDGRYTTECMANCTTSSIRKEPTLGFIQQILQKFLPKEVRAVACSAGGVYSSCRITCPSGIIDGGYCYYSTKSNAEQGACDAVCPAFTPPTPVPTPRPVNCRFFYDEPEENCIPGTYTPRTAEERAALDPLGRTPSPTPTPAAAAREAVSTGNTIPAGATITNYKISEADTDAGWSNAQQYPVSQRKVSYKFVPYVCVTQPCDIYPRTLRRVYVQLIGRNSDNSEYTQVFSKNIMLALKPVASSVSCEASATGTGTNVIIKGLHFGDDIGGVSVGNQNATIAQADLWTNLQTVANIPTSISAQSEITLTTPDGQKTTPVSCTPGQTSLNFKASATCSNITRPLTQASVEIREKSIGVGSTAPVTSTTSIFKNERVNFTSEGKPIDLNVRLIEGQEYNLIIQATNLLRRVISFKAGKGTTNIENVDLPLGDVAPNIGDCSINSLDRSEVIRQWGRSASGSATADFDQNGPVNTADLACLISNFNKRCENP